MTEPSFRTAVAEVQPAVRTLSDLELRAFLIALYAEMARRDGRTVAAEWATAQADRLRAADAVTAP